MSERKRELMRESSFLIRDLERERERAKADREGRKLRLGYGQKQVGKLRNDNVAFFFLKFIFRNLF